MEINILLFFFLVHMGTDDVFECSSQDFNGTSETVEEFYDYYDDDIDKDLSTNETDSDTVVWSLLKPPGQMVSIISHNRKIDKLLNWTPMYVTSDIATQEVHNISEEVALFLKGPLVTRVMPSFYIVMVLVSVPLNALALVVFSCRIRQKKPAVIYMTHLACVDLLLALLLPLKIHYQLQASDWLFGEITCRLVTAAYYCYMYCSILLMMCMSVDRLFAVVLPIASLTWRTTRNASFVCVFVWLLALAGTVPLLSMKQTFLIEDVGVTCHDVLDHSLMYAYLFSILSCILFFLPLVITLVSYSVIIHALSSKSHHLASFSSTTGARRRAVIMAIAVMAEFVLCFAPTNGILLYHCVRLATDGFSKFDSNVVPIPTLQVLSGFTREPIESKGFTGIETDEGVAVTSTALAVLNSKLTQIFFPVLYILVFCVGLPTNAMAIWVFLFRTKKKNPSSIFMANLALADLLFVIWIPLKIAYHFNGNNWIHGEALCKVLVGFFYGNMYCSTSFIACISVQRCWAIVHPLSQQKRNNKMAVGVSLSVWIVVWAITVPLYLYDQTVKVTNLDIVTCHDVTRPSQSLFPCIYFLTMGVVGFVVPCVICIVAYVQMLRALKNSMTDAGLVQKRRKAVILVVTVMVMFLVCFTPSSIMVIVHYALLLNGYRNSSYGFYITTLCLTSLNSCVDPFVYYFISDDFREHVRNTFLCRSERTVQRMRDPTGLAARQTCDVTQVRKHRESSFVSRNIGTISDYGRRLSFLGFVAFNDFVSFCVCKGRSKVHPAAIYLGNLAIADLMFVILTPLKIAYHLKGNNWTYGEEMCKVLVGFFYGNMYCSILFITCSSVHRCWVGTHTFTMQRMDNTVAIVVSVCIWIFIGVSTTPLYLYKQTVFLPDLNITTCHDVNVITKMNFDAGKAFLDVQEPYYYFMVMAVLVFFIPMVVNIVTGVLFLHSLGGCPVKVGEGKSSKKALVLLVLVLVTFLVCFIPSNVMLVVHYSLLRNNSFNSSYGFYITSLCLASLNSCLDPFIYYYVSEDFREKVKNTLLCRSNRTVEQMRVSFNSMKSKVHPAAIYMGNLAIADLMFVILTPLKIAYHLKGNNWTYGEEMCKVLIGFFYGNMYYSILFITCMSVQRYWVGTHTFTMQRMDNTVAIVVSVCIWIFIGVSTTPLYLYKQTVFLPDLNITTCHDVNVITKMNFDAGKAFLDVQEPYYYFMVVAVLVFFIPMVDPTGLAARQTCDVTQVRKHRESSFVSRNIGTISDYGRRLSFLGFVAFNDFVSFCVCKGRSKVHPAAIYMGNLAIADLMFVILTPLKIAYHLKGNNWTYGEEMCKVLIGFFYGNMYCSILFITCLSVQRYWVGTRPFTMQRMDNTVAIVVSVCIWIFIGVSTTPLYLYKQTVFLSDLNITTCHDVNVITKMNFDAGKAFSDVQEPYYYFMVMAVLVFFIPMVVIIVASVLLLRSLGESPFKGGAGKRTKRAVVLIVLVLVTFLVCFIPSNVMLVVHYSLLRNNSFNSSYGFYITSLCLASLNSCLDPFIYYYVSEDFREKVKNTLLCRSNRTVEQMRVSFNSMKYSKKTNTYTSGTTNTESSTC
ncbi:hypothetical protein DNTS_024615 [Danionella cerebrum]|uniref:G-protein coupled receptors family 1 profile domain-containing protein n=1 Tax=Danionella cerebrum TaxID=2873325 RepID=A0A553NHP1_9TELE|nr:hypothetical protein DNTS_024615 [Danionella translucida]